MEVTTRIIHDGPRNCIVLLTGRSDGSGPAETNVRKVDVSELQPPCDSVKVVKAQYDVSFGLVELSWDAQTPKTFLLLDGMDTFDFCKNGGLTNDLVSAGDDSATGDILLSTRGFEADSIYSIRLEMVKKYAT